MWKPEEIRDAEYIEHDNGNMDAEWIRCAERLATAILKHRSDYDSNCEPLPVDEAWLSQQGFRPINKMLSKCVGVHEVMIALNGKVVIRDRHEDAIDGPTCKTRPQLRSLLAALGGGM